MYKRLDGNESPWYFYTLFRTEAEVAKHVHYQRQGDRNTLCTLVLTMINWSGVKFSSENYAQESGLKTTGA